MTSEYAAALEIANAASAKFNSISSAYRNGKIDDATFLAARAEYAIANAAFEAAYAKEAELPEESESEEFEDTQAALFAA